MSNLVPDLIICFIILATLGTYHILSNILRISFGGGENGNNATLTELVNQHAKEYAWALRLMLNCFGYLCIFMPGYLIYKYTKAVKYFDRSDPRSCIPSTARYCLLGGDGYDYGEDGSPAKLLQLPQTRTPMREFVLLSYCFVGLMASYLTWGVLQEKIMTREYVAIDGKKMFFKDSQFLVFSNRVLAFIISLIYLCATNQVHQRAPLFKFSYASLSNIMSAWFQYEALKFVNFPTQVLAKSCKIIPVMAMGKIISKTKYEFYEYLTAIMISLGMIFFLTGSEDNARVSSATTLTGVGLLIFYMIFDSFTSNWQGDLFKKYSMTSIQMMCGVNFFSTLFTVSSLAMQGGFSDSLSFASEHPHFILDCTILSLSSAIGQLFIYYTIAVFGPVVFTIIMTIRQALAVLLSCLIYNHDISFVGTIGIVILFFAIFLRVYCNQRMRAMKKKLESTRTNMRV